MRISSSGLSEWRHLILPLRQRAEIENRWLLERLETVLPEIMRREGFDMWVVIGREYNEDPAMMSLLPAPMLSARRRTVLVFSMLPDRTVERLNLARPGVGLDRFYQGVWDSSVETQWECLARIIRERDPQRIGINVSQTFAFGDGLTHSEYQQLVEALDKCYAKRLASAERLAVGWLERRTRTEIDAYAGIVAVAHGVIAEAFSSRVVHPGVTTADDIAWWMRQRIHDIGLESWFHPSVTVQRAGWERVGKDEVIRPGDLLHCDVGLKYLRLATDTQQLAYVLKSGEDNAPAGLSMALATGNQLQEILAAEFVLGRTGNDILQRALSVAKERGIKASIYTHPIGYHGHGAGPTIGLWDMQQGVPGKGDYQLFDDTCYAMELNIKQAIPEWNNQEITIALEQTVVYTQNKVQFLAGRQTEFYLIG